MAIKDIEHGSSIWGFEFDLMFQSFKPETLPKDFSDLNNHAYKIYIQNQDCWLKQCGSALKKTFYATSYEQGTLFYSRWEAMDFIEKNDLFERYDIVPGYYTREGKLVLDPYYLNGQIEIHKKMHL